MADQLNLLQRALSFMVVALIRGLGAAIKASPPALWGWLASGLTPFLWLVLAKHRRRAVKNLMDSGRDRKQAHIVGMASFRSNLLVLFESLAMERIASRRGVRVNQIISPAADAIFKRMLAGEEPIVIAVSGHVGVWEIVGAEAARLLAPTTLAGSARRLKNPIFHDFIVNLRKGYGMEHINKQAMIRYVVKNVRRKAPHMYVFLCDQHFGRGEKVPFMNRRACTVAMPATLAVKYRCPVITGRCIRRVPGDYVIELDRLNMEPYADLPQQQAVREITKAINTYIETSIDIAPEQWTWAHRRWRPCCEADTN